MTISASKLASVNPGVLAAAGNALDLNGLLLSADAAVPVGSVLSFGSAQDVGNFFGFASPEYVFAAPYFQAPDNAGSTPGLLLVAQYNASPVGAFLRGGKLTLTLAQLTALTGTLTININGVPNTSASINLSAATSFSNAATIILAGFTAPDFGVTYDAQRQAFLFTSTTTGVATTATYATGTLAASLNLTLATGAVISQGADAVVSSTYMPSLVAITTNFASFSYTSAITLADADVEALAAWTAGTKDRYVFVPYCSVTTQPWVASVVTAADAGVIPVLGNSTHAGFVMGWAASLNFTQLNGRSTLALRAQAGLVPFVNDDATYTAALAAGLNFYGGYAVGKNGFNAFYNGSILGAYKWADSYVNQIWLNAQLQLSLLTLLQSVGSIPYNSAGDALIDAAINDPAEAAVNFGAIRTGIQLSSLQLSELYNALGVDVSGQLASKGFYTQVGIASSATRVARASPPINFYYTDGGSVQQLSLSSIEIQ